jgi:hypothetical protein
MLLFKGEVVSAETPRFTSEEVTRHVRKNPRNHSLKTSAQVSKNILESFKYTEASMTYDLHPVKGSGLNSRQPELYLLCLFSWATDNTS